MQQRRGISTGTTSLDSLSRRATQAPTGHEEKHGRHHKPQRKQQQGQRRTESRALHKRTNDNLRSSSRPAHAAAPELAQPVEMPCLMTHRASLMWHTSLTEPAKPVESVVTRCIAWTQAGRDAVSRLQQHKGATRSEQPTNALARRAPLQSTAELLLLAPASWQRRVRCHVSAAVKLLLLGPPELLRCRISVARAQPHRSCWHLASWQRRLGCHVSVARAQSNFCCWDLRARGCRSSVAANRGQQMSCPCRDEHSQTAGSRSLVNRLLSEISARGTAAPPLPLRRSSRVASASGCAAACRDCFLEVSRPDSESQSRKEPHLQAPQNARCEVRTGVL